MTDTLTGLPTQTSAMAPVPYRVRSRVIENADSVTLELEPLGTGLPAPLPGEFMMLYAFGVGEVAISTSGIASDGALIHTIRSVGAVSAALCAAEPGTTLGVRGPFGTSGGLAEATGRRRYCYVIGFANGTAHVETSSGYTRRFESLAEALEYAQPLVVGDPK